jgi:hypothetical protein
LNWEESLDKPATALLYPAPFYWALYRQRHADNGIPGLSAQTRGLSLRMPTPEKVYGKSRLTLEESIYSYLKKKKIYIYIYIYICQEENINETQLYAFFYPRKS